MPAPRQVTDEDILTVFHELDDPVLTTKEISNELPISRRAILNRLNSLNDEGLLRKKDCGGKVIIWWPTEE